MAKKKIKSGIYCTRCGIELTSNRISCRPDFCKKCYNKINEKYRIKRIKSGIKRQFSQSAMLREIIAANENVAKMAITRANKLNTSSMYAKGFRSVSKILNRRIGRSIFDNLKATGEIEYLSYYRKGKKYQACIDARFFEYYLIWGYENAWRLQYEI